MRIENSDHRYKIDYNDYGEYSCSESGCDDEGICRCYRIDRVEINLINLDLIAKDIYSEMFPKGIESDRDRKLTSLIGGYDSVTVDMYCINRILTINNVFEPDSWESEWSGNYYGDEVDSIRMSSNIFRKVKEDIETLFSKATLEEKIDFLLELEYGSILDKIRGKKYEVHTVDRNDLVFGQTNHLDNVFSKSLDFYDDKNYTNPIRGVAYFDSGKWRVIDGYHRINKTKAEKIYIIGIK